MAAVALLDFKNYYLIINGQPTLNWFEHSKQTPNYYCTRSQ